MREPAYVLELGPTFEICFAGTPGSTSYHYCSSEELFIEGTFTSLRGAIYCKEHLVPIRQSLARWLPLMFLKEEHLIHIWQSIAKWLPLMFLHEVPASLYMTKKIHACPMHASQGRCMSLTPRNHVARLSFLEEVDFVSFTYKCLAWQTFYIMCPTRWISVQPYPLHWFPLHFEILSSSSKQ